MGRVVQVKRKAETPRSPGPGAGPEARLELIESLLGEHEARACAVVTLHWLVRSSGIERALCAVVDSESGRLSGLMGIGVSAAALDAFSLDLDDSTHPLIVALASSEPVAFHSSGHALVRPFETPLGAVSFHAVPLARGNGSGELGPGLLLVTGSQDGPVGEGVCWAAEILGNRLTALWYHRLQIDERRHKRERSWLFGIINAVTDPILLTDADGRILVANAGAEMLLTAGEDKREGWRRAVGLKNMLFSASLFTNAAESGPTRPEVLLVDPSEGRDLLFEVLSTPVPIRLGETGVVSVLRNVTDLRRATEEIEENYRRLRVAEAATRAERDRLDLILNSVLDPILVTDAEGNIARMNPPAERMFTFPAAKRNVEVERRVRTNDAVFTSFVSSLFVSSLHAGQERHWRRTLSLIDPQTGRPSPWRRSRARWLPSTARRRRSSPFSTTSPRRR